MAAVFVRGLREDELVSVEDLFNEHRNDPFVYLADVHLFRLFSQLKPFRAFVAEADGQVIGCVYGLRYLYGYGWIGGLLVHKRFREMGVGRKLLGAVLDFLGSGYKYLFVEPQNVVAKRLFESTGFRAVYRRLNYVVPIPLADLPSKPDDITYDVGWDDMGKAIGFKERCGVINMGYYPIKVTEDVFEDLRGRRNILKCGSVIAVAESSYRVNADGYEFTFNDYVLGGISNVFPRRSVVEVNPFYIRLEPSDLARLINYLAARGQVALWSYEGDPVLLRLPLRGDLAALVMELGKG